jgi:hypothetical protein
MDATMTTLNPSLTSPRKAPRPTPPLQAGDRLSRDEFERRYALMPPGVKAELIGGTVYMPPAAVSADFHGVPHADLIGWLCFYKAWTRGVEVADNSTTRLDLEDDEPQPDACLYVLPSHGGRVRKSKEKYIEGAPELAAEVAASSVSYDLHPKLDAYCRNGVQEYVVWRTYDGEIDWFVLRGGKYERLAAGPDGIFRSEVFPGLWLRASELIEGRLAEVMAVIQQGVASPQHAEFVKRLAAAQTA